MMGDRRPNITLHIERLILDGLPIEARHGPQLQAAVEAELARLISEGGLAALRSGGAVPSLRAAAIQLPGDASPTHIGAQIGRSVYGAMGGEAKAR